MTITKSGFTLKNLDMFEDKLLRTALLFKNCFKALEKKAYIFWRLILNMSSLATFLVLGEWDQFKMQIKAQFKKIWLAHNKLWRVFKETLKCCC